jgi:hypothetical protein
VSHGSIRIGRRMQGVRCGLESHALHRQNRLRRLLCMGVARSPELRSAGHRNVARLSENSERLYESDNGGLGGPHGSAAGWRSGAPETEIAQRKIDFLSSLYKKSSDPGNSPTASRPTDRAIRRRRRAGASPPSGHTQLLGCAEPSIRETGRAGWRVGATRLLRARLVRGRTRRRTRSACRPREVS